MTTTLRTFWMIGMAVIFSLGTSACGQKHLSVSTSSGKAKQQEELETSVQDTPTEQTGIQDSSISEAGLGSHLGSQDSTGEETAMVVEPPPPPTIIREESAEDALETSETTGTANSVESQEGNQPQHPLGATEDTQAPAAYQTAMDPSLVPSTGIGDDFEPSASENDVESSESGYGFESPSSDTGGALESSGSFETDQPSQSQGPISDEEFEALVESPPERGQGDSVEVTHIEREPENIVIAKVEPSDAVEEQLARIKQNEMAIASAGLHDIFFEFDSWKITEEGKGALEKDASLLQEDTDKNLLIEGHCDQRGTQAYNIVLGKKRAMAIRDYLVALGVEPTRLAVVTYGKEKPFCIDETEVCYQENRRGHLIMQ